MSVGTVSEGDLVSGGLRESLRDRVRVDPKQMLRPASKEACFEKGLPRGRPAPREACLEGVAALSPRCQRESCSAAVAAVLLLLLLMLHRCCWPICLASGQASLEACLPRGRPPSGQAYLEAAPSGQASLEAGLPRGKPPCWQASLGAGLSRDRPPSGQAFHARA